MAEKEITAVVKIQIPAGQAACPSCWYSIGTTRYRYHGLLQGIQCKDRR